MNLIKNILRKLILKCFTQSYYEHKEALNEVKELESTSNIRNIA